jgi:ribosomal protein S18 acetylase RimI-like enzyme
MESEIIIRKYQEQDASELLRMWKESQPGWPMGLSLASGNSPEQFHRNLMQGIERTHFVAFDPSAERITGYGSFSVNTSDDRFSSLPLLNVHPSWQKRGIGRMLITAVVDEATIQGFRRVDLGTWPGNMYAVGLYKRCGFCWVPETEIYMVNYMPLIRTTPFLQPFFDRNNWFDSFQTDKTDTPDDHRIGQMKVYQYRFQAGNDTVTVTIDRNSAAVTGIETGQVKFELVTDDSEGSRGLSRNFTCHVRNRHNKPLNGSVHFTGRNGLAADIKQPFSLKAGTEWQHTREIDIPCDLEQPQKGPLPSVAAEITLDEENITLESGLKTQLPVECVFDDDDVFLPAGRPVRKVLNIENRLAYPVSLNLSLKPCSGLTVSPERKKIKLRARSLEGIPVDLTADTGGKTLEIRVVDTNRPERLLPVQKRDVCGCDMGQAGWVDSREKLIARNAFVTVIADRNTGRVMIFDRQSKCGFSAALPDAGPPFPFHSTEVNPDISCTRENGRLVLSVTSDSTAFRGVTRVMKLSLGDGPLIRLSGQIIARESRVLIPKIRQSVYGSMGHSETVIPTRDGILSHSEASFPFGQADLPVDPGFYPESWVMLRFKRSVAGFVWEEEPDEINWADWKFLTLTYHNVAVSPDKPWNLPDSHIYVGAGDVQTIQNLWADMSMKTAGLQVQPLIGFDRAIEPLIAKGRQSLRLTLRNRREFMESGTLILNRCSEAGLRRREIPVHDLNRSSPKTIMLTVNTRTNHPAGTELTGVFRSDTFEIPVRIPMILFPDTDRTMHVKKIRVHDHDMFRIDNGRMAIDVTPGFQGAVTSLIYDRTPILRSPFPGTGVLGFESPWYGGITPEIRIKSREKAEVEWTGKSISIADRRGIEWRGIRLNTGIIPADPAQQLTATMEYLTVPGCPVLLSRLRIVNTGTAVAIPTIMQIVFPGRNGRPPERVAFSKYGKTSVRYLSDKRGVFPIESWAGFASAERASGLAVIHANPSEKASPMLIDIGKDGFYVYSYNRDKIEPGDVLDLTLFVIPFDGDPAQARSLAAVRSIRV